MVQQKTSRKTSSKRRSSTRSNKKSTVPRRTKWTSAKNHDAGEPATPADEEATIDRRRRGRRAEPVPADADNGTSQPKLERRQKVNRRRQIDPTTCERDYTDQEVEFMNALDEYKRRSGRMFPTCSEVLEVIRSLGYVKRSPTESASETDSLLATTSAKPMPNEWSQPAPRTRACETDLEAATPQCAK